MGLKEDVGDGGEQTVQQILFILLIKHFVVQKDKLHTHTHKKVSTSESWYFPQTTYALIKFFEMRKSVIQKIQAI